jgi:cbb3-type cytochrome oxidase maturation protein
VESLYLLIPLGIVFVIIAIKILFWAINSGQYDNLDTEAHRILFDDDSEDAKVGTAGDKPAAGKPSHTASPKETDQ